MWRNFSLPKEEEMQVAVALGISSSFSQKVIMRG